MAKTETRLQKLLKEKIDPVYKELAAKIKEDKSEVMPWVWAKLANLEQAKVMNAYQLHRKRLRRGLIFPGTP